MDAADIRAMAYGDKLLEQGIVVELGGFYWQVVYVSQDDEGNAIATLYMNDNIQPAFCGLNNNNDSVYIKCRKKNKNAKRYIGFRN